MTAISHSTESPVTSGEKHLESVIQLIDQSSSKVSLPTLQSIEAVVLRELQHAQKIFLNGLGIDDSDMYSYKRLLQTAAKDQMSDNIRAQVHVCLLGMIRKLFSCYDALQGSKPREQLIFQIVPNHANLPIDLQQQIQKLGAHEKTPLTPKKELSEKSCLTRVFCCCREKSSEEASSELFSI